MRRGLRCKFQDMRPYRETYVSDSILLKYTSGLG